MNMLYRGIALFAGVLITAASCKDAPGPSNNPARASTDIKGCAPQTTDKAWYSSSKKAPRLKGLEGIDFRITTINTEAQEYFNQGLMLAYGFNHAEAARSFFEASRLDSTCAMAYWGFAYVLGPNYNAGMEADNYQRAYEAAQTARRLSSRCTAKEKALINALQSRYAPEAPADRSALDSAFAAQMKQVYQAFPDDPDISALYAESLMDRHPWDMYDKHTKEPKPWTGEIVTILETLTRKYPKHPGAPHFYIHAVEASKTPERALASARLLGTLVPGSGHLVHMASHIYIWTGDYHLGSLANINAVKIDSDYVSTCHAQGAYPLAYYPHNYHYLSATATFEGRSGLAWIAANKVREKTAKDIMAEPGWGTLQHYYTIPYFVAVKFNMWDSILAVKTAANELLYPTAILHYARGMAFAGRHQLHQADKELAELTRLSKDSTLKQISIWGINSMYDIVQIAVKVLTADIARSRKNYIASVAAFREAIVVEDNLNYDEPPDWFFSVRHHLGQALLEARQFDLAEKVYREDLDRWKENGWGLIGLYHSLKGQNKLKEAVAVKKRFDKAWQYADFDLAAISEVN